VGDTSGHFEWPTGSRYALWQAGHSEPLLRAGSMDEVGPWASVSKAAVAFAVARGGELNLQVPLGPPGSSLRHLLAHASGLGLEATDPVAAVGTRRIYSNVGIDIAISDVAGSDDLAQWFDREVAIALDLSATLSGRASSGAHGSVSDLGKLGLAWLQGPALSEAVRRDFSSVFLPDLSGVVPGFGRFSPCPWGLGVEIHGEKTHWMGSKFSPRAFGHFGQSGSLLLVDPEHSVVVAALAGEPFGPWATTLWPQWMDWLFSEFIK
jgi:CubicO group peptidase (beta-lactamase class C family)